MHDAERSSGLNMSFSLSVYVAVIFFIRYFMRRLDTNYIAYIMRQSI